MKRKHIILIGLAAVSLASCSDFLDVDAPSATTKAIVYDDKIEANKALTGVYAQILSNSTYGDKYLNALQLNSDVDFKTGSSKDAGTSNYYRFDCTAEGGDINSYWTQQYKTIEQANDFVYGIENGYYFKDVETDKRDAEVKQMYGEAKLIRAMAYHDLLTYFGDIPFDFTTTTAREDVQVMPVKDRTAICDTLIKDLISLLDGDYLKPAAEVTVERGNREFCQAMIARIALTAGGYSLRPDANDPASFGTMKRPDNYKDYYAIARKYAKQVIDEGKHSLALPFRQVFIDECNYKLNNADDPIFEIPFTKYGSGNVGYIHGPSNGNGPDGTTGNPYGEAKGSVKVSKFYPYMFDPADARRDYVIGMWSYKTENLKVNNVENIYCYPELESSYNWLNNKWSKLWQTSDFGADKSGSTGINFPYMRYADVLLMFAEADNEVNDGPTQDALDALQQVRDRAFADVPPGYAPFYDDTSSKEGFLKTVLHERALEFAGENMRWKDLVRNNMYAENIIYDFYRYYTAAEAAKSSSDDIKSVGLHDDLAGYVQGYTGQLPNSVYYQGGKPNEKGYVAKHNSDIAAELGESFQIPNDNLEVLIVYNPYETMGAKPSGAFTKEDNFAQWWPEDPRNELRFSFFGYLRADDQVGTTQYLVTGNETTETVTLDQLEARISAGTLPPVRYILPYPAAAIQRSAGAYKNQYGYK